MGSSAAWHLAARGERVTHMAVAGEGVQHEHRVGAVGGEPPPGLVRQPHAREFAACRQRQRLLPYVPLAAAGRVPLLPGPGGRREGDLGGRYGAQDAPLAARKPASRSALRSARFSMPTDRRTRPGEVPVAANCTRTACTVRPGPGCHHARRIPQRGRPGHREQRRPVRHRSYGPRPLTCQERMEPVSPGPEYGPWLTRHTMCCSIGYVNAQQRLVTRDHIDFGRVWSAACCT
jgi:hypothetical protein